MWRYYFLRLEDGKKIKVDKFCWICRIIFRRHRYRLFLQDITVFRLKSKELFRE